MDEVGDRCDEDIDGDGLPNDEDNCIGEPNLDQTDTDVDGVGDACDPDDDNDGVGDEEDNCPLLANGDQADNEGDGLGDLCDPDDDNDGVDDGFDNCPLDANPSQIDFDRDGDGDACDLDDDGDGTLDVDDVCAAPANTPVNPENGCSLDQLVPCEGPRGSNQRWKNHRQYVSSVAHAVNDFARLGLITETVKGELISQAAQSSCGSKP